MVDETDIQLLSVQNEGEGTRIVTMIIEGYKEDEIINFFNILSKRGIINSENFYKLTNFAVQANNQEDIFLNAGGMICNHFPLSHSSQYQDEEMRQCVIFTSAQVIHPFLSKLNRITLRITSFNPAPTKFVTRDRKIQFHITEEDESLPLKKRRPNELYEKILVSQGCEYFGLQYSSKDHSHYILKQVLLDMDERGGRNNKTNPFNLPFIIEKTILHQNSTRMILPREFINYHHYDWSTYPCPGHLFTTLEKLRKLPYYKLADEEWSYIYSSKWFALHRLILQQSPRFPIDGNNNNNDDGGKMIEVRFILE